MSTNSVTDYKQEVLTQSLVSDLKRLKDFRNQVSSKNLVSSESGNLVSSKINTILNRIESKSFTLGVVGEFKRGKSTFINALIGKNILPSDILPATATLNRIVYREKPGAKICFKDRTEKNIEIEELANYVTRLSAESETTANTVKEAVVYLKNEAKNRDSVFQDIQILDTPGLNEGVSHLLHKVLSGQSGP